MTGTRRLAQAAMTAGAYVVLTWAFGPISYGAMQFRLAEVLKPLALWGEQYIHAGVPLHGPGKAGIGCSA